MAIRTESPSRTVVPTSWLDGAIRRGAAWPWWATALCVGILIAAAWLATYASGGSQRAFPHLFYIPIIGAAMLFGFRGGIPAALVSAIAVGPLMPLNTATGEAQQPNGWLLRAVMFCIVAGAATLAMEIRERVSEQQLTTEIRDRVTRSYGADETDDAVLPALERVLAEGLFHVVYQPAYSLADGRLVAVEALTRFDAEPRRTPDVWFRAAAIAGLGTDLEIAAIEKAADGARDLPRHVSLAVNASPATLADPRLHAILAGHPDRTFAVEITEHAVVEDYALLQEHLSDLRALGVRLAVDDTGAGFSSLRHIVQLAPDIIKIDISLAQGVGSSPLKRALATSLTEFAHAAGARMVVEGIEDVDDLVAWSALGAEAVQGYLTGRPGPLPVAETSAIVAALRSRLTV
ncbi:EAL domain-containing protein [Actinotalea fermentans]|uniref:EAL domain-containing protein n=1 Tax=Actinotalea fermentans TaxID=43671 RepID=A0A511YYU2_9CELL|nr:EAL domain-containing protein [Actinotalea fermentans]KGM17817.1 hypothetical protein N867_11500 [Actinotalea fermentans ATCC 43279 = JCM 9966 = DSM 3133]GEN80306.1 hypothetical protein AFE02nite_20400 [Actinotalea fermentans]